LTGQVAFAVGLGGVAEAWYDGHSLLDAFQHLKITQDASGESEAGEEEEEQGAEQDDFSQLGTVAACYPQALACEGYPQALAVKGGGSEAARRLENQENVTNFNFAGNVAVPAQAARTDGSSAAPNDPIATLDGLKQRELWTTGSCIEVFSSSASKWCIGQVKGMALKGDPNADMVTVLFVSERGQIMEKTMPRSDSQLATFGRNTRLMPPNFQKVASESRPGQFSYQDAASGAKYQTKELAWQNYYGATLGGQPALYR